MYKLIVIPLALFSFGLKANETSDAKHNSMKIGFGYVNSLQEQENRYSESKGIDFSIGYFIEDNWLFEAGLVTYPSSKETLSDSVFLRSKKNWQVSSYASLYVGAGLSYLISDLIPTMNAGINYYLNDEFYVDIGYQGLLENSSNIYSFLLSLNFKMPIKKGYEDSDIDCCLSGNFEGIDDINLGLREITESKEEPKKYYNYYLVIKNDNLTKISKKLNIRLNDIVLANPQLSLKRSSIDLIYPGERIFYPIK
ncbi:LysM peptidoglycan-binding domain-containing protein [Vibrio parahaemolyticus]